MGAETSAELRYNLRMLATIADNRDRWNALGRQPSAGAIGEPQRHIEIEPVTEPVSEPVHEPAPAQPVREPEPVPA